MKKQNGITLIALIISIIIMLILAGVSINAVVGDNGVISKAQETLYLQSCAVLEEFLQMEASNYALEENPYETQYGLLKAKHPDWFYQNAQGYILDADGHVMYLIKKSGLPQEIQDQITGGDANKVSQYYKQVDVYGVTSDLQVYYCNNGTDTILGLTTEDLDKDNPLEIAYDEDSLLSKVINGTNEEGKANEALSEQDLKSIKTLTIDSVEKLGLLKECIELPSLETVHFKNITIPTVEGIQYGKNIVEVRFIDCSVSDYSALCGLTKLNRLYLIRPAGKNTDVATLCSSDKGIATAEFTNLRYFGIVGNEKYLQSTKNVYSTVKYDVTDVSGLDNLSKTTKEAIQYMYLQNLQATSIACLEDFINVIVLRLEWNALTTLEGIQNMSKLKYLLAPALYSDVTKKYTLGINETDTKNVNTDALSYIYKNANGQNTSLYFTDLGWSYSLKWSYGLKNCTALRYLYLKNTSNIKDISEISGIIANCGINQTVDGKYAMSIIADNTSVLSLSGKTLTVSEFEQLKNRSLLTHLSLDSMVLTTDAGVKLTNTTTPNFNEKVNEVLSTCTNLKYLQLTGLTYLTSIDFIGANKCTNLIELDLRNSKNVNDLTNLNTYAIKLQSLDINNDNINLVTIVPTLNRCYGNTVNGDKATYWYGHSGVNVLSWKSLKTLENCTELKVFSNWDWGLVNATSGNDTDGSAKVLDLSNTKINYAKFAGIYCDIILPNTVQYYYAYASKLPQFSSAPTALHTLIFQGDINYGLATIEDWKNFVPTMSTMTALKSLTIYDANAFSFDLLEGLSNITTLTNCVFHNMWDDKAYALDNFSLRGIENLKNVTNLQITNLSKLTDISSLSGCTKLKELTLTNTSVSNISALRNLTQLQTANLSNNRISNVSPLSTLINLETLNLQNNTLYDVIFVENGGTSKAHYTLTTFADLNQNQDGKLKNLNLSGNYIDDFSMLQDSNLKWDSKTGW